MFSKGYQWWGVIGIVLLGFMAFFAVSVLTLPKEVSPTTLCRTDGVIPAYTAVLIDQSDVFSSNARSQLEDVEREARALPKYGKLAVYQMDSNENSDVQAVFEKCSPGSEANPFIQNPTDVHKQWNENFDKDLQSSLKKIESQRETAKSPIIEKITGITGDYSFSKSDGQRKLIIISDLLQNSDMLDLYNGDNYSFERFLEKNPELPRLNGASVYVYVVHRKGLEISPKLIKFWRQLFVKSGAGNIVFTGLPIKYTDDESSKSSKLN